MTSYARYFPQKGNEKTGSSTYILHLKLSSYPNFTPLLLLRHISLPSLFLPIYSLFLFLYVSKPSESDFTSKTSNRNCPSGCPCSHSKEKAQHFDFLPRQTLYRPTIQLQSILREVANKAKLAVKHSNSKGTELIWLWMSQDEVIQNNFYWLNNCIGRNLGIRTWLNSNQQQGRWSSVE